MSEIRIGLIDSNELVRAGRSMLFSSQPNLKVVFEESDPNQAVLRTSDYLVDVLIVAGVQHGFAGFSYVTKLVETLRESRNSAKVLVSGAFYSNQARAHALLAGATDFVGQDTPAKELLALLKVISRHDYLVESEFLEFCKESHGLPKANARLMMFLEEITEQQRTILKAFLSGVTDFQSARALDIAKSRVTSQINELIEAGDFLTRNQLAVALSRVIL
ncbi:MAG: hypothetical protein RLZZ56_38 [Actinomycetota bacterium]